MDPDVVEADPTWAAAFDTERTALSTLLAAILVTGIEHVGSTAVAGLAAKPVIDMIAGVASLDDAARADAALRTRGYAARRHRPEARLFVRADPVTGFDTHHLHLTVPGSDIWTERLVFRDALRRDPDLVARYASWKRAHRTGRAEAAYDTGKTPFVAEVLAAHGVALAPDDERLGR